MSGQKKGGEDGRAPGGGGFSKRGKPRPGTGGYRRDKLEGKGPTPPAHMRPGHPAQRAAAKAARDAARPGPPRAGQPRSDQGRGGPDRGGAERGDGRGRPDSRESFGPRGGIAKGSGEGPE